MTCRSCQTNRTGKCRKHREDGPVTCACGAVFRPWMPGVKACASCRGNAARRARAAGDAVTVAGVACG